MKLLIHALLIVLALPLSAQPANEDEKPVIPFPEANAFQPPRSGIFFSHDYYTVEHEMGAVEVNALTSNDFKLETPSLERWALTESKEHSAVFSHPLFNEIHFHFDCWPTSAWPELKPEVFQGRVKALAEALHDDDFSQFEVRTMEDDFTVPLPTKILRMADGREIEVPKRGHTRPFRVADQYAYELLALKLNNKDEVEEEFLVYETICVHPKGYLMLFQVSGPPDRVGAVKGWLNRFLLNSKENPEVLARRPS